MYILIKYEIFLIFEVKWFVFIIFVMCLVLLVRCIGQIVIYCGFFFIIVWCYKWFKYGQVLKLIIILGLFQIIVIFMFKNFQSYF